MALEFREKRIGSTAYRVTQLPAKRGRSMLVRFVRLAGPSAGAFVGGLGRSKDGTFDGGLALGIAEGVHELSLRMTDDDLTAICDEFAKYTVVIQSREVELRLEDVFDDHFAGRYDEMLAWLRFCLEVNFTSFFAGSSGVGAPLAKLSKILTQWQSPKGSTGTSTGSPRVNATPTI